MCAGIQSCKEQTTIIPTLRLLPTSFITQCGRSISLANDSSIILHPLWKITYCFIHVHSHLWRTSTVIIKGELHHRIKYLPFLFLVCRWYPLDTYKEPQMYITENKLFQQTLYPWCPMISFFDFLMHRLENYDIYPLTRCHIICIHYHSIFTWKMPCIPSLLLPHFLNKDIIGWRKSCK